MKKIGKSKNEKITFVQTDAAPRDIIYAKIKRNRSH